VENKRLLLTLVLVGGRLSIILWKAEGGREFGSLAKGVLLVGGIAFIERLGNFSSRGHEEGKIKEKGRVERAERMTCFHAGIGGGSGGSGGEGGSTPPTCRYGTAGKWGKVAIFLVPGEEGSRGEPKGRRRQFYRPWTTFHREGAEKKGRKERDFWANKFLQTKLQRVHYDGPIPKGKVKGDQLRENKPKRRDF